MSRYYSYLNSASKILTEYPGREPFSIYLKGFFSKNKKYGSRDRREIGNLCYCYFRLGKSFPDLEIEERLLTGLFLCSNQSNKILELIKPGWAKKVELSVDEKVDFLNKGDLINQVFPWKERLSEDIDHKLFTESFFIQPNLFLRLRPGREEQVLQKLQAEELEWESISEATIALPNSTKIAQRLELNRDVVIQDLSSQKVGEFLKEELNQNPLSVWDCCAASGGKSIMMYDLNPAIKLTVTDVRESILINLKKRFHTAGIQNYESFQVDLTQTVKEVPDAHFDMIVADVPCSGSGTWSRTPEQLFYFDGSKIQYYGELQRKIVSNALPQLKVNGYLVYITCSVFRQENETNIEYFKNELGLEEVKTRVLKGYDQKADSMFVSLLKKN